MLEKLKEINRNASTEKTASVLIILALLHLINVFAFYYKTKFLFWQKLTANVPRLQEVAIA